jgi:hypothetical protein
MKQKLGKATKSRKPLHPRDSRSPRYPAWKRTISEGMRSAKLRRREAGLLTFTEAAVELGLSRQSIETLLPAVAAGPRNYIRRADLEKWKAEAGGSAA